MKRIADSIALYRSQPGVVIQAIVLSVVIHVSAVGACWFFLEALQEPGLGLAAIMAVVPIGLIVKSMPFSPGGLGTGTVAFAYLFTLVGSRRGADVFNLYLILNTFSVVLGAILYLRLRADPQFPGEKAEKTRRSPVKRTILFLATALAAWLTLSVLATHLHHAALTGADGVTSRIRRFPIKGRSSDLSRIFRVEGALFVRFPPSVLRVQADDCVEELVLTALPSVWLPTQEKSFAICGVASTLK